MAVHGEYILDVDTKSALKLYLFKNVTNVGSVRNSIVTGEWKCAALKPALIVHPLQVAVAANKACLARRRGQAVTRSVFTEILYNLSISKNITQSLSKFGVETDSNLLVCFLLEEGEKDHSEQILPQIHGELRPIDELTQYRDMREIKSVYKLNNISIDNDCELLDHILSRIAAKGIVSL